MRRGTTPTITVTVDADLTGFNVHLALKNGSAVYVKENEDLDISVDGDRTVVSTTLTQEETLSFKAPSNLEIQIRAEKDDGTVAIASAIGTIKVEKILEDGVING